MKRIITVFGVTACVCGFFAGSAFATTINGTANIVGNVTVTATTIQFFNGVVPNTFTANGTSSGSFVGLTGGAIGMLNLATEPVGVPIDVVDYATFDGGAVPVIDFDLTEIVPGYGTNAGCNNGIGNNCTPTGSPFTLTQIAPNEVNISLSLDGISYQDGSSATAGGSPTISDFTTQIVVEGTTVTGILTSLAGGGSESSISYSAAFTATPPSTVPEPASATLVLFGAGLVGLGLMGRRRYRRG